MRQQATGKETESGCLGLETFKTPMLTKAELKELTISSAALEEQLGFLLNFFLCGKFLKSLLNLLQYCFCILWFGFSAPRHVGFQLPN